MNRSFAINDRNFTFQGNEVNPQPFKQFSEREVPPLLPYLANRSTQEFELGNVLQYSLNQIPLYPLFCIIHGDEFQCHYKFLERLQKVSLPRMLEFDVNQIVVQKYHLKWPSELKDFNKSSAWLCKNLADAVLGRSFASLQDINKAFYKYPAPVIIYTNLLTEDWKKQGFQILDSLLSFWQGWPDLISNQQLIVCVCIKYQFGQQKYLKKDIWWPLRYCNNLFRAYQFKDINRKISKQLEDISTAKFGDSNRI
ncbi:MAG TPA: hypothetical protein DCF68_16465 [Cyanothece sp. UBA12306]|nr:hypothetical protein [Cyanothece sp. UBA12306]